MTKNANQKLGIKENMRTIFVLAPDDVLANLDLPVLDVKKRLSGKFDYIHLFAHSQQVFHKKFPLLKKYLRSSGMLWVSWPKSGLLQTDLNIKIVIKLGYDYGLVESKAIGINETWSALKFTWPKDKVVYNNSFGTLKY